MTHRERERERATNVTRVIKVARSRSATRRLITIFRGSPHTLVRFCSHPQRAEWPGKNESAEGEGREEGRRALFFRERPRTEVARGGAPSVGGPPVELKLMDKGRRGLAIFIELTFLPSRITRRARVLLPPVHARAPRIRLWSSTRPSSPTYFYNELGFNNTTKMVRRSILRQ